LQLKFANWTPVLRIKIQDPKSGAFLPLDPGSQTHFLGNNFSGKNNEIFFGTLYKNKVIFHFVKFMSTKKGRPTNKHAGFETMLDTNGDKK
jgi:hypothetical protein